MRKWPVHVLAITAVMQWGVAQAQEGTEDPAIPPSPEQNQSESDQNQDQANQQDEASQNQSDQEQANEDRNQSAPGEESIPDVPERAPAPEEAGEFEGVPRPGENVPGNMRAQTNVQGDARISQRVREATANLDISDETRARYRWQNGEWWFETQDGTWMYHRNGEWHDFDPTAYQPIAGGMSGAPAFQGGGSVIVEGNSPPLSTHSANSYYYDAPSYQPVRPAGVVYGTGYRYGGRYYDGSRRIGPYRSGYYDGYGYDGYGSDRYGYGYGRGYTGFYGGGPGFYNRGNDRYYGYGPYGERYSIEGDRYRGGVIGSEIGGRIGGGAGAVIGGAIGAEAAED